MANQNHLDLLKQGVEIWNQWKFRHPFPYVDLNGADLQGIDLNNAELRNINLSSAKLNGADFSKARLVAVILVNVDFHEVMGLDTANHSGPSEISLSTIFRSLGCIPETFLHGAGVPNSFIEYMRSLIGKPIEYYTCFISYSSKDEAFAKRLYADLQSNNVRCWFAPEDLKWGEKIRTGIDEAIHMHDKLLLILSKHSVASGWVEHEVKSALAKERKEKRIVLFPIRLDKAIFDSP